MEDRISGSASASSALVFATDGAGRFPDAPPSWPVIWLRTPDGVPGQEFPFGIVVDL